jgi:hypothetical protein
MDASQNEGSEFAELICNGWDSVREGPDKFVYCSCLREDSAAPKRYVRVAGDTSVTRGSAIQTQY